MPGGLPCCDTSAPPPNDPVCNDIEFGSISNLDEDPFIDEDVGVYKDNVAGFQFNSGDIGTRTQFSFSDHSNVPVPPFLPVNSWINFKKTVIISKYPICYNPQDTACVTTGTNFSFSTITGGGHPNNFPNTSYRCTLEPNTTYYATVFQMDAGNDQVGFTNDRTNTCPDQYCAFHVNMNTLPPDPSQGCCGSTPPPVEQPECGIEPSIQEHPIPQPEPVFKHIKPALSVQSVIPGCVDGIDPFPGTCWTGPLPDCQIHTIGMNPNDIYAMEVVFKTFPNGELGRINIPSNSGNGDFEAALSTVPGDFNVHQGCRGEGFPNIRLVTREAANEEDCIAHAAGDPGVGLPGFEANDHRCIVEPGETYYFNVRALNPNCKADRTLSAGARYRTGFCNAEINHIGNLDFYALFGITDEEYADCGTPASEEPTSVD